jgi:hypothetical protein
MPAVSYPYLVDCRQMGQPIGRIAASLVRKLPTMQHISFRVASKEIDPELATALLQRSVVHHTNQVLARCQSSLQIIAISPKINSQLRHHIEITYLHNGQILRLTTSVFPCSARLNASIAEGRKQEDKPKRKRKRR